MSSVVPIARLSRFGLLLCLLTFWGLALNTAVTKAATVDESIHITRGRAVWQTRQMMLQFEHAPLSHWLNGSLLFLEPTLPTITELPSWSATDPVALSSELLWRNDTNLDRALLWARLPIILLGLLLGAILMRWARELTLHWLAPLLVGILFAFSPNLLASFTLAITDGPLTALYTLAIFTFWRHEKRPSWWRGGVAGLCLGLALATKISALILLPITLLLAYRRWRWGQAWWRPGLRWSLVLPLAGLVLWSVYGFETGKVDITESLSLTMPVPTYIDSFLGVQDHIERDNDSYLLGQVSADGWWHYFAVTFALKTPLPILLLLLATVGWIVWRRDWRTTAVLWLPTLAFFAAATYSRLNIGYRHILPMLPLLLLLIAYALTNWITFRKDNEHVNVLTASRKRGLTIIIFLFVWYGVGSLRQRPHFLAYFNELAGGSQRGYQLLDGSNVDWGQDLKLLAEYVASSETAIRYSYYGGFANDPTYYDLPKPDFFTESGELQNFARANPAPGRYVLSVTHVQPLGRTLYDPDTFDWFRRQTPTDYIGYSLLVYDVTQSATGNWIAHCLNPAPLVTPEVANELVGQSVARHLYFDCHQSWVWPDQGEPGWYILPQQASESWLLGQAPADLTWVYRHNPSQVGPAYDVYYWSGRAETVSEWLDTKLKPIEPIAFGKTVVLRAYNQIGPNWLTAWQVSQSTEQPLTVAGHLYAEKPTPTIADGLGFTTEQWQPGDIFVQYHLYEAANGRFLETGLYNYLTGEKVPHDSGNDDFVPLSTPK